MLALSFRTKLILAMSFIVAGVTGATMLVTQQRVQATYKRLFEEQFHSQISYFSDRQSQRLATVAAKCDELGKSTRVVAAMQEVLNKREDPQLVHDNVYTELLGMFRLSGPGDGSPGAPPASALGRPADGKPGGTQRKAAELPFIRVLNLSGIVLPTTDPRVNGLKKSPTGKAGAGKNSPAKKQNDQVKSFMAGKTSRALKRQEIGYMLADTEDPATPLREFVITPIIDKADNETLGAFVVGFPLADFGEQAMFDFSRRSEFGQLLSGIWLDAKIYSHTIPESVRDTLAMSIARELVKSGNARDDFVADVDGVPHRVFYKVLNPGSTFPAACQVCLFSLNAARQEEREVRWRIIGFGAVALAGALVLILFISHGLTVPIQQLVRGTREIRAGNFDVKVPVRSRDEIGQLAASFNEMADGLALSQRYQAVLSQVADKEVAEAMMKGEVALGGELRDVSVLFCDIRGFTALTQTMPPAEVIAMLNEHMTALTAVVYEHHGVVDKFVGDLIMAVFGAPKSYGHDAHHAARCALRMIQERTKLNETSAHKIAIGIGVSTGRVVAGCMGSADRLNYTVLGERVNLGSRLCSIAGRMEVVIDESTRTRLSGFINSEPLPEMRLKGFTDLVNAYRLTEVRSRPEES
ncbi:MAG: HAMP domain-containing protein [Verrucomicrobia bacterium]|nr:HAMP domain-containing protein [Verrucomicrobiota bacterium]